MSNIMNIGQAASRSGVSSKMIRYYEAIGLLPAADRRDSGYRSYSEDDVHRLSFVKRARDLGFSLDRIKGLLDLWSNQQRSNDDVRTIARAHLAELEAQATKLAAMIGTLRHLVHSCEAHGKRSECPIIEELGDCHAAPLVRPNRTRQQGTTDRTSPV